MMDPKGWIAVKLGRPRHRVLWVVLALELVNLSYYPFLTSYER